MNNNEICLLKFLSDPPVWDRLLKLLADIKFETVGVEIAEGSEISYNL